MSDFYANILLQGPEQADVVESLQASHCVAYVAGTVAGCTVLFHEDLAGQEELAASLSREFACPALLVMDYGGAILLYQLYVDGATVDAYVSRPHEGLELPEPVAEGDAAKLCAAFGMEHAERRVATILNKPTDATRGYALAVNRHGDLFQALKLPLFAAGVGFKQIAIGELPAGKGFDPALLIKTGA